jgi:hypothetical protein
MPNFTNVFCISVSRVAQSVQFLATGWTTGRSRFDPRQRQRIFPVASVSRPTLRPTQPPVQWVLGVLSPGLKRDRGVTLTTHPYLVPRSRISRSYTCSPPKRLHGVWWDSFSFISLYLVLTFLLVCPILRPWHFNLYTPLFSYLFISLVGFRSLPLIFLVLNAVFTF